MEGLRYDRKFSLCLRIRKTTVPWRQRAWKGLRVVMEVAVGVTCVACPLICRAECIFLGFTEARRRHRRFYLPVTVGIIRFYGNHISVGFIILMWQIEDNSILGLRLCFDLKDCFYNFRGESPAAHLFIEIVSVFWWKYTRRSLVIGTIIFACTAAAVWFRCRDFMFCGKSLLNPSQSFCAFCGRYVV